MPETIRFIAIRLCFHLTLDGSRSSDPEQVALSYRWTQISGWNVQLSDPTAAQPPSRTLGREPTSLNWWSMTGCRTASRTSVTIVVGSNHAPVANAGPSLYVATNSVALDGTGSYDPDGYGTLTYQWRQISGPTVTMTGTNTRDVRWSAVLRQTTAIQKCVFELIVSDGDSGESRPANVTVTIVPNFGTNALMLDNPPFDPVQADHSGFWRRQLQHRQRDDLWRGLGQRRKLDHGQHLRPRLHQIRRYADGLSFQCRP